MCVCVCVCVCEREGGVVCVMRMEAILWCVCVCVCGVVWCDVVCVCVMCAREKGAGLCDAEGGNFVVCVCVV